VLFHFACLFKNNDNNRLLPVAKVLLLAKQPWAVHNIWPRAQGLRSLRIICRAVEVLIF